MTALDAVDTLDRAIPETDDKVSVGHSPYSAQGRVRRFVRGAPEDPAWARPALLAILAITAFAYIWKLGINGWSNSYYSAAVQAGSSSWKAFFFGSLDSSNFITVDKSPAFLWPMDLLARVIGVNTWSILLPEVAEGLASVAVLYAAVRRWHGAAAGLIAAAALAATPVAAMMFRFNNPDAMLTLLMTLGAYAVVRAVETGRTRWVLAFGSLVGWAFLAKMLQGLLVLPAFGFTYLLAGPPRLGRRVLQLAGAAVAMVVSAGWWVAIVELWPASSRPYIGGSQSNSVVELIFGYNGFGRLTGNENGSVGGAAGQAGRWGATGIGRLFNNDFGGQISWLLPAALIFCLALLALAWRAPRTDRLRASAILWGGWLLVTGLAISLGKGIIHTYYTIALAPAIAALVGIGAVELWKRRSHLSARLALAATLGATVWWANVLLSRTPTWMPALHTWLLIVGAVLAVELVVLGARPGRAANVLAVGALVCALTAPIAVTWQTVRTPHEGSLPTAGPASSAGFGPGRGGPRGGNPFGGGAPPAGAFGGAPPAGGFAGAPPGLGANNGPQNGLAGGPPSFGGGGLGGILNGSTPSSATTNALTADAGDYTWMAATISANQASGYQLATGRPVMAIGGFNGTDPAPTLAEFQQMVAAKKIHWFIGGGSGPGGRGGNQGSSSSSSISSWVAGNFRSTTAGGTTIYDLTSPLTSS